MGSRDDDDIDRGADLGAPAERYRWLREVNRGGVGIILGARDPIVGRRVAIKVLRPELEGDERVLADFTKEARVTGQLDHPNIVPVYDFGSGERSPFLVMKWIPGKSLLDLVRPERSGPKQPDQLRSLLQIVLRLCEALSFAHARGVVHCDLKPENVMVGDHGQVYLMDWGMAVLTENQTKAGIPADSEPNYAEHLASSSETHSVVRAAGQAPEHGQARGTPAYMAPEQAFGLIDEIDERTDVFGMGGILCEILLGEPPNNQRTLLGSGTFGRDSGAPTYSRVWSQLPPELCRITAKALAPKRADRYPNIAALRSDLEQFLHGGGWFETRVFAAGTAIVTEGDAGDAAYVIERGHCDVFKLLDGKEVLIRRLGPGAVFGEMAVFTGGNRSASVVAVDEVTLKVITGASLNKELDQNPWVAAFVRSLARLVRDTEDRSSRPSDSTPPDDSNPR